MNTQAAPVPSKNSSPVWVEPDLDFIRRLRKQGGESFKKCMQCGTCSAACALSPDTKPFPRKEMAWATWGRKERLLKDPDVWLCHQCNDCSTRCPRGARPGDILAAVRQECVTHYAFPRFFARWVNQPQCAPLLLGIPIVALLLALFLRDPIEMALGISTHAGERIVYTYSSIFPHWLLNAFFGFFSLLVLLLIFVGAARFWRAMKAANPHDRDATRIKGVIPSILSTFKGVFTHENFAECTRARSRYLSHFCVLFGFMALSAVTIWVITAKYNPLIRDDFIYPFNFFSPWKMLANVGGAALVAGCLLMSWDRLSSSEDFGAGTYFDWALISKLLLVAFSGFATEALHFVRLEPHRHIAYFVHLVFVFALLIYLPYSKLAHMVYRGVAMVFAERTGREWGAALSPADTVGQKGEQEGKENAKDTAAEQ
ncbi:quinone-interacting membrane-bound oxidoreductase complex subunit QmoC [Acidobacteriota bacterium]